MGYVVNIAIFCLCLIVFYYISENTIKVIHSRKRHIPDYGKIYSLECDLKIGDWDSRTSLDVHLGNWDAIVDGNIRVFKKGIDFHCPASEFIRDARLAAKKKDLQIKIKATSMCEVHMSMNIPVKSPTSAVEVSFQLEDYIPPLRLTPPSPGGDLWVGAVTEYNGPLYHSDPREIMRTAHVDWDSATGQKIRGITYRKWNKMLKNEDLHLVNKPVVHSHERECLPVLDVDLIMRSDSYLIHDIIVNRVA